MIKPRHLTLSTAAQQLHADTSNRLEESKAWLVARTSGKRPKVSSLSRNELASRGKGLFWFVHEDRVLTAAALPVL